MKRIFVAIDLSDEARGRAAAHIGGLRKQFPQLRVGWERPEKLHLTLKFIGDTDDEKLEGLKAAAETAAKQIAPFRLLIGGCGVFPPVKKARILWLGVHDVDGAALRLNDLLENECEKIGIARETRDFKPHLTIARLREPHRSRELVEQHLQTNVEPVEDGVSEIVIYESRLQATGSIYTPVSRHKLTG